MVDVGEEAVEHRYVSLEKIHVAEVGMAEAGNVVS